MLKRLFISLLILSALTSDGTVVLPPNIYQMVINSGSQYGLPGQIVMSSEQTPRVEQSRGATLKLVAEQIFSLTSGSFEKIKYQFADCYLVSNYHVNTPDLTANPVLISYFAYNKGNVLVKSGTSPPYTTIL